MSLKVEHATKRYKDFTAVEDLNFQIEKGEIFGLIGQNGAGKTTTFRMILDLQETTEGQIYWDGQPMNKVNRDVLGYLPEERGIFPQMKVEEQLQFFGELRGMKKAELKREIDFWIERFELEEKRHEKAETLSKGNQQKVQLIASFIHKPKFLILDEPFSGLDPVNKDLLKNAILHLRDTEQMTVLFSSHQMDNVEELCDHLCLLKRGVSLFSGSLLDLKKQYGKTKLTIRTERVLSEMALPGVKAMKHVKGEYILTLADESFAQAIFETVSNGQYIEKFSLDYLSLDEIFKDQVGASDV